MSAGVKPQCRKTSHERARRVHARSIRGRLIKSIFDEAGCEPREFAIYTLSDPRAIRDVRYVGQTRAPTRRLWQHVNTARPWQPDEVPWWFKSPELRPLYEWIRQLYM